MPTPDQPASIAAWQRSVLAHIAGHPDRPLRVRALARELGVSDTDYTSFRRFVRQLLDRGVLILGAGRTLRIPDAGELLTGTFQANRRGFGFLLRPGHPDIYVHARRTGGARDGDTVTARLLKTHGRTPGPRAEIVRVIRRAVQRWVGILERAGSGWCVQPQGREGPAAVRIDDLGRHKCRPGDLVLVEPLDDAPTAGRPRGIIVECLGDANDARVRIQGIIRRFDLRHAFPPEVQRAAREAAQRFNPQVGPDRLDLRELPTITIDPAEARDYDDAISIERTPAGHVKLGVHIADVSHFVPPGGPVDLEAQQRSTSVYFPGYAIPMLPEELSNGVCCLSPGQERLTKSIFITYDRNAKVIDTQFAHGLIRSHDRLTYEQAARALAGRSKTVAPEIRALLKMAAALARKIQRRRRAAGMLSLNLPEVEISVNGDGQVLDAGPASTDFSHTLIEMFMVEANEAVARALRAADVRYLRRIHPQPERTEAASLAFLAPLLGHAAPRSLDRESLGSLLTEVEGKPGEAAVNFVLLRSLPQASYSPEDEGHFALASSDYCHFTSPIRRYPDLLVHRALERVMAGDDAVSSDDQRLADEAIDSLARSANAAERRAQQAEREATQTLLLLLMRTKLGARLEGVITGVISRGVFVQVKPYLAEGFVAIDDFGPDMWDFDRSSGCFTGRRTRRIVHLGQTLRVQVASVDVVRGEMVLVPCGRGPIGTVASPQTLKKTAGRRRITRSTKRQGKRRR